MTTLVIIPTFNERETLAQVVGRTRTAVPGAEILVVDDASPDGTGELADHLALRDAHVHVLHRAGKDGLGRAYVAAFRWAADREFDVVVEMDGDGSHRPEDLPAILATLRDTDADLVLGSRWVPGGWVLNWPRTREVLSRGGNAYARVLLGLPVRDATGGFRAYRAGILRSVPVDDVGSQGYCFQIDMVRRVVRAGGTVVEVPITFVERTRGTSKMSKAIVAEAVWRVTVWGITDRLGRLVDRMRRLADRPGRLADRKGRLVDRPGRLADPMGRATGRPPFATTLGDAHRTGGPGPRHHGRLRIETPDDEGRRADSGG